jgi:hypothetical protein
VVVGNELERPCCFQPQRARNKPTNGRGLAGVIFRFGTLAFSVLRRVETQKTECHSNAQNERLEIMDYVLPLPFRPERSSDLTHISRLPLGSMYQWIQLFAIQ